MSAEGSGLVPGDHPDRLRWNAKYGTGFAPSFRPHPLAVRALALGLPDGPVADLACGPSGAALMAAEQGRPVTAVDVSEVALGLLGAEAGRRGLGHLITLVHADLSGWAPEPRSYALVLAIGFWDAAVFRAAAAAVADSGLLAWEALTADARRTHPGLLPEWCLMPGQPASLLPPGFAVLDQSEVPARNRRRLLARRTPARMHTARPPPFTSSSVTRQRQQHHHRPRRWPAPALQLGAQLLDLAAWTFGEHADRAHTDHDLAGRLDDGGNLDPLPARLMSTPPARGSLIPVTRRTYG